MTDDKLDGGTGREGELGSRADTVWVLLCECLARKVAGFNSDNTNMHASLELGVAIGQVKVKTFRENVSAALGFELAMNTAGLNGWVQRDMIRVGLPILLIDGDEEPSYRFGEEAVSVPALVDRAFEYWCKRAVFGHPFQR